MIMLGVGVSVPRRSSCRETVQGNVTESCFRMSPDDVSFQESIRDAEGRVSRTALAAIVSADEMAQAFVELVSPGGAG